MHTKKKWMMWAVLLGVAAILWVTAAKQNNLPGLTYSQFIEKVQTGQVASVTVMGANSGAVEAICRLKDGKAVRTVLPQEYRDALIAMQDSSVEIEIREASGLVMVQRAAPFLLLLGVWVVLMTRFPRFKSITL
jgi:cell division protease FtsH